MHPIIGSLPIVLLIRRYKRQSTPPTPFSPLSLPAMSPSLQVVMFLFCAVAVHGVRLPGGCPLVPATDHSPINGTLHQELVLSVPFTDPTSTYLFKESSPKNVKSWQIKVVRVSQTLTLNLHKNKAAHSFISHCYNGMSNQSDSIALKCSIRFKDKHSTSNCHPVIDVNVRMWLDGQFLIIWSCKENLDRYHEEAVLLVALLNSPHATYHGHGKEYWQMMKRLKETVRKYLTEPLLNKIQWTGEIGFGHSSMDTDPLPCTRRMLRTKPVPMSNLEIVILAAVALTIIVYVGVMVWYGHKDKEIY